VSDSRRLEARIRGRVQGVWFRESTRREAERIGGLTGFVRNVADGSVELVAEGPAEACERLVQWCHRGPELARVDDVTFSWKDPEGGFTRFEVAYG